ncbi:hypothetical protein PV326_009730 [Microctonus aethiopoides]|nr:hypothetical protein PV326_009730 [Microctonus aethiopoides]
MSATIYTGSSTPPQQQPSPTSTIAPARSPEICAPPDPSTTPTVLPSASTEWRVVRQRKRRRILSGRSPSTVQTAQREKRRRVRQISSSSSSSSSSDTFPTTRRPALLPPRGIETPPTIPPTTRSSSPESPMPPSPPILVNNSFNLLSVEREHCEEPSLAASGVEEWALNFSTMLAGRRTQRRCPDNRRSTTSVVPCNFRNLHPNPNPNLSSGRECRTAPISRPEQQTVTSRRRPRLAAMERDGECRRSLVVEAEAADTVDEMEAVADKLGAILQAHSSRGSRAGQQQLRQRQQHQARPDDRIQGCVYSCQPENFTSYLGLIYG